MMKLTENQINYLDALQSERYAQIDNTLKVNAVNDKTEPLRRMTVREQVGKIEAFMQENKDSIVFDDMAGDEIGFIKYLDKNHFRFDSFSGQFMTRGWEVKTENGIKLFLTGENSNRAIDDKLIARADNKAMNWLGLSLNKLLSAKFPTYADWKQFT